MARCKTCDRDDGVLTRREATKKALEALEVELEKLEQEFNVPCMVHVQQDSVDVLVMNNFIARFPIGD